MCRAPVRVKIYPPIKAPSVSFDLLIGDRNGLLMAARVLAYGKDYQFKYPHPETGEEEVVTADLQTMEYKKLDETLFNGKNEFDFTLPFSKNRITFKLLTVGDDKKIDEEAKGLKKALAMTLAGIEDGKREEITTDIANYMTRVFAVPAGSQGEATGKATGKS